MNNTIDTDADFIAVDRFMTSIFYADDDILFDTALVDAIDEWTATVSAEHNDSKPFTGDEHDDPLRSCLGDLFAAVAHLNNGARPGLTIMRAINEALADWRHD